MKTQFNFKGMMVPVFTPFNDDKKRTINFGLIDKYAQFLKSKGMQGVMVNGLTGEGMTLRLDERKRLAEEWMKVTRKHQLTMVLNIGGAVLPDVYEMAEHAEELKVDAVMVMPDLFFKPRTEEDMLNYMRDVVKFMPTRPIFYYHIPMMTDVRLNLNRLMELTEKEMPTFVGVLFADVNLDDAVFLKKFDYNIIMGMRTIMMGVMVEGFEALTMTAMNICPEMVVELYEHMRNNRMREAMTVQEKLTKRIQDLWRDDMDIFTVMKMEFNKMNTSLKMGPIRKPLNTLGTNKMTMMGRM